MSGVMLLMSRMSLMLKIEDPDHRSLDSFPLHWRWDELPAEVLNSIRPLNQSKARELCQYSLGFSNQSGLVGSLFEHVSQIETSDDSPEIRQWLLECSSDLNQTVAVSWDNELAALVSWKVFCEHWDDFCYPSSDDAAIFPLSGEWMLFYSHDEYFMFGKIAANGAA